MPACFQLINKVTRQPTKFQDIDEALCAHLNRPCDPVKWLDGWYDCIGFALAMGRDWQWCRENFEGLDPIIDYLEEHYTFESWHEVGKR